MIGRSELVAMKNDGIFVNAGRGDTVDTDALVEALQASQALQSAGTPGVNLCIGAAVLDVVSGRLAALPAERFFFSTPTADLFAHHSPPLALPGLAQTDPEPLPDGHVLFSLENVVLTPHCSWASEVNFHRATDLLELNSARFAAGEPVLNVLRSKAQ